MTNLFVQIKFIYGLSFLCFFIKNARIHVSTYIVKIDNWLPLNCLTMQEEIVDETDVYVDVHKRYIFFFF